ncbi:Protein rad9 [Lachnellula hyalina]|uniref:Sister chromatid cohesion protein n=1 Tax=Lachnellula hyalina TaxID=1316788 RepID=A0A8H8QVA6_9HELO|nr:Protein rad9 [Lachnellula hyalina]TVY22746.1 Protein rad9 [Lachnellula hyalina]
MATNGYSLKNGDPNVSNGTPTMNRTHQPKPRVLTVDEALPLTPFTSIVPFNSDIVPLPLVGLRSSVSLFPTEAERENGRQGLESLNREAADPQNTSQRLQRSLDDLKALLKPEGIPQYTFKTAPKFTPGSTTNEQPRMTLSPFARMVLDGTGVEFTCPSPPHPPQPLSSRANKPKSPKKSRADQSQHQQRAVSNQTAHNENSTITVQIPKKQSKPQVATPPQPTPFKPSSGISVVIPSLPNDFRRDQYTPSKKSISSSSTRPQVQHSTPNPPKPAPQPHQSSVPMVEIPIQTSDPLKSAPRPPQSSVPLVKVPTVPIQTPTQQIVQTSIKPETPKKLAPQPSPAAPRSGSNPALAVVIPDLPATFKAEGYDVVPDSPDTPQHLSRKRKRSEIDEYEEGSSLTVDQREKGDAAARNLRVFLQEIFEVEDQIQPDGFSGNQLFTSTSEGISLTTMAQTKVESLLQKIISAGRFTQAPLDELLRLQKLSEGALKDSENIDVKIYDSMGDSEVEAWLQQVDSAEIGLKAARTSLRLMSGGREDRQLYSEDVILTALNSFKNVVENCIVPVVEMRSSGSSSTTFKLLSAQKKVINNLLTQCRRVLSLLASLVANIELSETVINILEFTTSRLIFVENAPVERDSILGVARFDSLRVVAMDALAQIFLCFPTQRQGIFDEILTSLEKLPVTKQSARQFKLAEGGSIQLVSALIMRLIQTSASKPDVAKAKRRNKALEALNGDDDGDNANSNAKQGSDVRYTVNSEPRAEQQAVTAIQELKEEISPLLDTAKTNASYVVGFIVGRAMKSTKTGDAPYRNLLDLFVEDFITCLNSPDWPAAELLLRLFLFKMVHLAEGDKTPAPAKNMALDLLGLMGSAISELNSHVRKTATSLETGDELAQYLVRLAFSSLGKRGSLADLVSWSCGPFRVSLEYLEERYSQDPQLHSAIGYFMAEWASKICSTFETIDEDQEDWTQIEAEYGRLAYRLRMMVSDRRWLSTEYSFDTVSPPHARIAYSLTLLHSQFCESFGRVLTILLGSMTSEQATVRSKSLKSVNQVLDTDPTILDREPAVMNLILRCSNDASVQVRDSALNLVGKCISLRPALEEEMIPGILQRVNDSGIGVRKRAMRLSKDIYLRNTNRDVRSLIADSLLHRVVDQDEGVQELARQTIEEVWMSPFYQPTSVEDTSAQFRLGMADHVALMVKTVQRGSGVSSVLDKVLKNMLSEDSKYATANFKVCKALVATMFETIIDNPAGEGNEAPSARDTLLVLMIFAKSNAKLFTPEQIQLLQPYTSNVSGGDDMAIFRSVIVIFRHVLPHLSKAHNAFLGEVRKVLIQQVGRMGRAILDDLIACLWIISEVLGDFQNLTRLTLSSLVGINGLKNVDLNDPTKAGHIRKITRLLLIGGMCGKHCDLNSHAEFFKQAFPTWKDNSVSKLMCDTFAPFASPSQPLEVRKGALDAIGMVCQSWPKNFSSANIYTSFREVFNDKNPVLETIVLGAFKDFLLLEEKRSEAGREALPGAAADPTAKLGVMGGGQGDGVAIGIAQRFLVDVVRIALSRQDEQGLLATEVIASVARQGLVHPKECGVPLIALETSQNLKIAEIAFREHRAVHEKHETILEKEYMRAVQMAYTYQRDVAKNTNGATLNPYTSKLHQMIEVLKISKVKNRKRFFETLCSRIDFDPAKIDIEEVPHHLDFSQFIIENMAFFEYATVDELLAAITAMEKVVAATGTGIAHSIETEIFHVSLDQPSQVDANGQMQPIQPTIDPRRMQLLTASSMMLTSLWSARTFLRRQYGLMNKQRDNKNKSATKDLNRAPVKAQGVSGDKFWEDSSSTMTALDSEDSMMNQCRAFVELLNVDHDFKVAAEGDEEAEQARLSTPSEDEEGTPGPPGGSGRGRKRKSGGTPGGRKKRARSSSVPRGRGRAKNSGKSKASVEGSDGEDDW